MRSVVFEGPNTVAVESRPDPRPGPKEVVVRVEAVGLCATDRELFDGSMAYFQTGEASYPLVPGHEWAGTVESVGDEVATPVGTRVVGDVFIPCGSCRACDSGAINICPTRYEVGVRGGWDGAMAELVRVPERILYPVPPGIPANAAVFAEPGVTALHAIDRVGLTPSDRVLILGTGTLGLLALQMARLLAGEVHAIGPSPAGRELAVELGAQAAWDLDDDVRETYDVAIEASGGAGAAALAVDATRPGGRIALIGLPPGQESLDPVQIVLKNRTVYGILGGPGRFPRVLALLADGSVRTEPLVQGVGDLDDIARLLTNPIRNGRPKYLVAPNSRRP